MSRFSLSPSPSVAKTILGLFLIHSNILFFPSKFVMRTRVKIIMDKPMVVREGMMLYCRMIPCLSSLFLIRVTVGWDSPSFWPISRSDRLLVRSRAMSTCSSFWSRFRAILEEKWQEV